MGRGMNTTVIDRSRRRYGDRLQLGEEGLKEPINFAGFTCEVVCAWVAYEPYVTPASAFKNQTYWQESQIEVHTFGCRPLGCMRTICASSCV